jgi:hypothetical protein
MSDELVERIEKIERQCAALRRSNARWRAAVLASTMGVLATLVSGAMFAPAKVIETEVLRIRDATSKKWAQIRIREGGVELAFSDTDGQERLIMGIGSGGTPYVTFLDPGEKTRIILGVNKAGDANHHMYTKAGKSVLSTRAFADGSMNTTAFVDDVPRFGFEVSAAGSSLTLQHKDTKGRIHLRVEPSGLASEHFMDPSGKPRIFQGITADGEATQVLRDTRDRNNFISAVAAEGRIVLGVVEEGKVSAIYVPASARKGANQ